MTRSLFLAGATGAVGRRLAPLLVAAGWRVVGSTRSAEKAAILRAIRVEPVVVDVFDAAALKEAVRQAAPAVVVHQLTDLPPGLDPARMAEAGPRNARIREEGTRNLVAAAVAAGAHRVLAQSVAFFYAEGRLPHREEDPLDLAAAGTRRRSVEAVASLERQVLAGPFAGTVLRYGLFYGPGTGFAAPQRPPSVHVDAAAKAAELAVTRAASGIFNITEEDGAVTSGKARRLLGWDPAWRAGP